jgi:hypothetical protein
VQAPIKFRMAEVEEVAFHDVIRGNTTHLDALVCVYSKLFPHYLHYIPLMRHRARFDTDVSGGAPIHQWLVDVNGEAAGIVVFRYLPSRNFGFLLDLGILPEYRAVAVNGQERLSAYAIKACARAIEEEAQSLGLGRPNGTLIEIESPKLVAQFQRYGLVELPVVYNEPPTSPALEKLAEADESSQHEFRPMHLGLFPGAGQRIGPNNTAVAVKALEAVLLEHYGLPRQHWAVESALASIRNKPTQEGE